MQKQASIGNRWEFSPASQEYLDDSMINLCWTSIKWWTSAGCLMSNQPPEWRRWDTPESMNKFMYGIPKKIQNQMNWSMTVWREWVEQWRGRLMEEAGFEHPLHCNDARGDELLACQVCGGSPQEWWKAVSCKHVHCISCVVVFLAVLNQIILPLGIQCSHCSMWP